MEVKKLKGITIFAWLMLILNAVSMLANFDVKAFFAMYKFLPQGIVLALYCYGVVSEILGIVASIGILRLKESMRKISVAINALDILICIPFFFFLPGIKQSCYEMAELTLKGQLTPLLSVEGLAKGIFYSAISAALVAAIITLIFIWYFTCPKVKAQFK